MTKAIISGVGILLAAYALWFVTLQSEQYIELNVLILWGAPFVAALVSAYLAPTRKILLGASMALPAAVMGVALNYVFQAQGNAVDFPGGRGALILFTTTLVYSIVLCGLGAVVGRYISNYWAKE